MESKEEFLAIFQKCIEDGNIVIGLEKEYNYDSYINIYPTINIYNPKTKENYDSGEKFKYMSISIKE